MLSPWIQKLIDWFRDDQTPLDPRSYTRVPVHRGPTGRASSVAVEEPREPDYLSVVGRP